MREKNVTRLYLAAFAAIAILTLAVCSYFEGRVSQIRQIDAASQQAIDRQAERADYWKAKYRALAHEADWLTVTEAEAKFQQGRAGQ